MNHDITIDDKRPSYKGTQPLSPTSNAAIATAASYFNDRSLSTVKEEKINAPENAVRKPRRLIIRGLLTNGTSENKSS